MPKKLLVLAVSLLVIVPAAPASAGCRGAGLEPGQGSARTVRAATLCLINRERSARGLGRLRPSAALRRAAQRHAADMARRNYFSHVSPGGSSPLQRVLGTGFGDPGEPIVVGENLGWGSGATGSPAAMVRMWMDSPSHRANILNPRFRRIGIGVAAGAPLAVGGRARTYATDFGG